jgi:hypothetical protein
MKRTLSAVALSIALVAGGATSASADVRIPARELSTVNVRPMDGVKACERYLKWADRKHTEARADRAVIVCGRTVRTERQAKRLNAWAKRQSAYIRDLIG